MILFIKHINIEGPETMSTFFKNKGFQLKTVELQEGSLLPENLSGIDAVVSLGGPMNVYEEDKYPFLMAEHKFLQSVVAQKVPFLGICLGSQLLAKACEATVGKSPEKEIGFFPVHLTEKGKIDPLFAGVAGKIDVFQWHEDMSQVPRSAELLAASEGCPHQAVKVGPCAYGLQFHIEVTEPAIRDWCEAYFSLGDSFRAHQARVMLEDYRQKEKDFSQLAETIYHNFSKIIKDKPQGHG